MSIKYKVLFYSEYVFALCTHHQSLLLMWKNTKSVNVTILKVKREVLNLEEEEVVTRFS